MRILLLLLIMTGSLLTNAQNGKGVSIYKSFDFTTNEINKKVIQRSSSKQCFSVATRFQDNYTFAAENIGFINETGLLAYSIFYNKLSASQSLSISIRFSKNNTNWTKWTSVGLDEHNESTTRDVSNLDFINEKYKWYQLKINNSYILDDQLRYVTINFFNPNENKLLYTYKKSCAELINEQQGSTAIKPKYKFDSSGWNLIIKDKLGEFLNFTIPTSSLADFDWEKQLKLDYEFNDKNSQPLATNQTNDVNGTEQTAACPCPLPSYTTRVQWSCPQGQGLVSGVGTSSAVTHLIVHHSAGANTATDWNAVVLSIWNFHTGTNGYSDIGYNWLIAPNGQLYEGRGSNSLTQNVTGAHFCGTNANTMGVCMIGTYTSTDITAAARSTLTKLLAWKCCQQNIPPSGTALHTSSGLTLNRISGHRDGCATDCPGTLLYGTLPALRTSVQQSIDTCGGIAPPCMPSLTITSTGCPNNTITFTPNNVQNGGTTPSYSWFLNNVQITTGNSYTLSNAVNGDKVYAIMTSNANCANPTQVNSDTIALSCIVTTALPTVDGLEYCRITPNPNNGVFAIQLQLNKSTMVQYRVLNAIGKAIWQSNATRVLGIVNKPVALHTLAAGTYLVEIYFDNKKLVKKIIVN